MLKKILISCLIIIWLYSSADAFLWNEDWLDLYKDIEAWMDDIELKNFQYEITWGWLSISETIAPDWLK